MKQILVETEDGKFPINIASFPDTCPLCLQGVEPLLKVGILDNHAGNARLQVVFQCPRMDCSRLFISYYAPSSFNFYILLHSAPQTPKFQQFSDYIVSVSEEFVNIFQQSQYAEQLGLAAIAGPGYRKSLEFLIKDYSIQKHPESAEDIKKKYLAAVIKGYVSDPNLKSTANRATWLGNDETHYDRKWEDKDIRDLKILIELTVRWIESEELTRKYEADMKE